MKQSLKVGSLTVVVLAFVAACSSKPKATPPPASTPAPVSTPTVVTIEPPAPTPQPTPRMDVDGHHEEVAQ